MPEAKKKKYLEAPEVELPLFWRLQTIFVYICFALNGFFQELCWLVRAALRLLSCLRDLGSCRPQAHSYCGGNQ